MLRRPGLLILDEPWEGLDAAARDLVPALIDEVLAAGGSVLVSDHRGETASAAGAARWTVADGTVTAQARPSASPGRSSWSRWRSRPRGPRVPWPGSAPTVTTSFAVRADPRPARRPVAAGTRSPAGPPSPRRAPAGRAGRQAPR